MDAWWAPPKSPANLDRAERVVPAEFRRLFFGAESDLLEIFWKFFRQKIENLLRLRRAGYAGAYFVAQLRQILEGVRLDEPFAGNFNQRGPARRQRQHLAVASCLRVGRSDIAGADFHVADDELGGAAGQIDLASGNRIELRASHRDQLPADPCGDAIRMQLQLCPAPPCF